MESKIKRKHPKVHKYLFTVTTLSKLLALYFFIFFPLAGFYLGTKYQQYLTYGSLVNYELAPKTIGGDKDAHGCLIGAGYSWCGEKSKCIRAWEEQCQATPSAKVSPVMEK